MRISKLILFLLTISLILTLCSCSNNNGSEQNNTEETEVTEEAGTPTETDNKTLVAYFSATNNTEAIAQDLAERIGADIYEITPEQPYTDKDLDYNNPKSRSTVEMNDPNARPKITGSVDNMDQYDIVYLGNPIWWGEAPRIMNTFIKSYDFNGKTIVPFVTSSSSDFANSDSSLKTAAPEANWLEGHRFPAGATSDEILEWVHSLNID